MKGLKAFGSFAAICFGRGGENPDGRSMKAEKV